MIIFGTRARTRILDEGEFYCPQCRMARRYTRKQARPYFALYFVPVFPVGQGREFVECKTCGTAFEPGVLGLEAPQQPVDLATLLNGIKPRLAAGTPLDYILRDLTSAGLDYDVARATIDSQLGGADRSHCPACGLTYTAAKTNCAECGGPLVANG